MNGFIKRAISETIQRDSSPAAPLQAIPQAAETPQEGLLALRILGYDPIAGKDIYVEKNIEKSYYVEAMPISHEANELPF